MKKALITGAAGFLGSRTAAYFKKRGFRVIGIDWVKPVVVHREDDWCDAFFEGNVSAALLEAADEGCEVIVHCAGSGSVAYSNSYPAQDFERNVITALTVLEHMRILNRRARLIIPSSAAVYGNKTRQPIKETDRLTPISPYGFHKKIAEELCASYARNFGLNVSIVRFFSLYGPGLRKQLLWDACTKFMKGGAELTFSGTGKETRDWLHIDDAVSLIYHACNNGRSFQIVNGGSGKAASIRTVLDVIAAGMGKGQAVSFDGKIREGDPKHYHADITRALGLGWKPRKKLKDGIKEYVRWFKKNSPHLRPPKSSAG
jgi:UDP-glucose 4-epimerase